jgi:hypothetical protein
MSKGCGFILLHLLDATGGVRSRVELAEVRRLLRVQITRHPPHLGVGVPLGAKRLHLVTLGETRTDQVDAIRVRQVQRRSRHASRILGRSLRCLHLGVHLRIERAERIRSLTREASGAMRDRLHAITEDAEVLDDVLQAASGDDVITRTVEEGLADDLRPLHEIVREGFVAAVRLVHQTEHDLLLDRLARILLLNRDAEAFEERLVQDVGAGELLRTLTALTLRVASGDNGEASSTHDIAVHLLEEHATMLQHRLKAVDLARITVVEFVKQQHRTTLHGDHNRSVLPHALAVDESEATEQIVLVGEVGEVDTHNLAVQTVAHLLHHRGLAVAGQTRDEDGEELARRDDLLHIVEVTVGHIGAHASGNHRALRDVVLHSRNAASESSDSRSRRERSVSRSVRRSDSRNSRSGNRHLRLRRERRNVVGAVLLTVLRVVEQPRRRRQLRLRGDHLRLAAGERRTLAHLAGGFDESFHLLNHASHSVSLRISFISRSATLPNAWAECVCTPIIYAKCGNAASLGARESSGNPTFGYRTLYYRTQVASELSDFMLQTG